MNTIKNNLENNQLNQILRISPTKNDVYDTKEHKNKAIKFQGE